MARRATEWNLLVNSVCQNSLFQLEQTMEENQSVWKKNVIIILQLINLFNVKWYFFFLLINCQTQ